MNKLSPQAVTAMAAPFVPVPVPFERAPRADRAASVGSDRCSTPPRQSPVPRARLSGPELSVQYSSCPPETPRQSWDERPITPTVLGYEVMEERAKFTVSPSYTNHSRRAL